MKRLPGFLTLLLLVLSACGSDASSADETLPLDGTLPPVDALPEETPGTGDPIDIPELDSDDVVFVWSETGGCAQAGPNCARYEVSADGSVSTYREGQPEAEVTGSVPVELVNEWLAAVAGTDIDELGSRLGPGEMTAAFDGVDYTLSTPHTGLVLSSVDVEFVSGEAFFATATKLARAAAEAAPLPLEMR